MCLLNIHLLNLLHQSLVPEQFFKEVLVGKLHARAIVIGSNYFFGKGKAGNVTCMRGLGEKYDVEIIVVDTVKIEGEVISSTHIRSLISEGKMEEAEDLLGHPYTIIGTVVHGKKLRTYNWISDFKHYCRPRSYSSTKWCICYNSEGI